MKILVVGCEATNEPPLEINELRGEFPTLTFQEVKNWPALRDALAQSDWGMVICGWGMSWINGLQVLSLTQQRSPSLPVIMVTAAGDEEIAVQGMKAGLRDYLTPKSLRRLRLHLQEIAQAPSQTPLPGPKSAQPSSMPAAAKELPYQWEKNHQIFTALLNAPTDIVLLIEPDGTVQFANQTFLARSGYSLQEVIGKNLLHLLPKPLAESRLEAIQTVARTGQPIRFEDRGVEGWLDIIIYPVFDDHNRVALVGTLARDITERKKTEAELLQSNQTIRALLHTPTDVAMLLDASGRILQANETLGEIFGKEPEDLIGEIVWDYLPPGLVETRKAYVAKVFQTGEPVRFEDLGLMGVMDTVVYPIFDAEKRVVQAAVMARDITERKQSEMALRRNEALLRAATNIAPLIVFAIDVNGTFQFLGGKALAKSGYMEDLLRVNSVFDILKDKPHVYEMIRQGLAGEEINQVLTSIYNRTYQLHCAPQRDEAGNVIGLLGVALDITELKQAQQDLQTAYAEMAARVEERTAELAEANLVLRNEILMRAKAEEEIRRNAARAEALAKFAARLNADLDLRTVAQTVCDQTLQVVNYQTCCVALYDKTEDAFTVVAAAGDGADELLNSAPIPRQLFDQYFQFNDSVIVIPDVRTLRFEDERLNCLTRRAGCMALIMLRRDGELVGVTSVSSLNETRQPSESEILLLNAIADQATIAIANALLFQQASESRARLQDLSERLVMTQEMERRRIASELHDEIGQMLTSLSFNLESVEWLTKKQDQVINSPALTEIRQARQRVDQLLQQVRNLSLDLRPAMLEDLGLIPALLTHFERFTSQTGIRVNFRHNGVYNRYKPAIETAAFRMIQEALTNTARYAKVDEVMVRFWASEDTLVVQVEDEGVGFDPQEQLENSASSGLSGIRERVMLCGGVLEIDARPGRGVSLAAEFPVAGDQPQATAQQDYEKRAR